MILTTKAFDVMIQGMICSQKISFGSQEYTKELKGQSVPVFCARLASFGQLGLINDALKVSKRFHNGNHDHKGQENKIYTILMGMETFCRRHTASISSCSEVKYVYVITLL